MPYPQQYPKNKTASIFDMELIVAKNKPPNQSQRHEEIERHKPNLHEGLGNS
jgi:hypothetical protein